MLTNLRKITNSSVGLPIKVNARFSFDMKSKNETKNIVMSNEFHEKAYLSSQIMKMIQNPIHSIKEMSLKNQIRQFLENDKLTSNDSKKQIYDIFDNGISINTDTVYIQTRVKNSLQKSKIIFHPTKFATGQMFNKINQSSGQKFIIGHFGISKTISTILYQKLSEFIIDYKMRTKPQDICKNILNAKRLFYWTINIKEDTQQSVNKLIEDQLLNSEKKFFDENKTFQQNWKFLRQAYRQRKILTGLSIDQINNLIAQVRQKGYRSKQKQINKPEFQTIIRIQKIIQSKLYQFYQLYYLSSINAEQYLLEQIKLAKQPRHYKIIPSITKINFQSELYNLENRIQIIDFFIETYNSFFKQQVDKLISKEKNVFYETKKKFYETLRKKLIQIWEKEQSFYLTQLVIHFSIKQMWNFRDSSKKFGFNSKCQSLEDLKKLLIQFFRINVQIKMPSILQKNVQRFFDKASRNYSEKLFLLAQLYEKYQLHSANKRNYEVQITLSKEEFTLIKNEKYQQMLKVLDQHLFAVQNGQITLVIPPEVFFKLKIQKKERGKTKKKYLKQIVAGQLASKLNKNYFCKLLNRSGTGNAFENIIKLILTSGSSSLIIKNNANQQVIKEFNKISQTIGIFNVFQSQKNYDFLQNITEQLSQMLKKCQKQNTSEINRLFLPVVKNTKSSANDTVTSMKQKVHEASKALDFMIINYNRDQKKFSLHSFDVTIETTTKAITEKIEKFLESYQNLKNKNQKQIKIGNQVFSVQLYYYTMTPNNDFSSIVEHIQKKLTQNKYMNYHFQKYITASQDKQDQIAFIPRDNFLLKQIGHLSLGKNIRITNEEQKTLVDFELFKLILQESTRQKSKKKGKKN